MPGCGIRRPPAPLPPARPRPARSRGRRSAAGPPPGSAGRQRRGGDPRPRARRAAGLRGFRRPTIHPTNPTLYCAAAGLRGKRAAVRRGPGGLAPGAARGAAADAGALRRHRQPGAAAAAQPGLDRPHRGGAAGGGRPRARAGPAVLGHPRSLARGRAQQPGAPLRRRGCYGGGLGRVERGGAPGSVC